MRPFLCLRALCTRSDVIRCWHWDPLPRWQHAGEHFANATLFASLDTSFACRSGQNVYRHVPTISRVLFLAADAFSVMGAEQEKLRVCDISGHVKVLRVRLILFTAKLSLARIQYIISDNTAM